MARWRHCCVVKSNSMGSVIHLTTAPLIKPACMTRSSATGNVTVLDRGVGFCTKTPGGHRCEIAVLLSESFNVYLLLRERGVFCVQIKELSPVQKKTFEFPQFKSSQLQRNPPQTERGRYSRGPRFREMADHQIRS